jgi:hypothetical protein
MVLNLVLKESLLFVFTALESLEVAFVLVSVLTLLFLGALFEVSHDFVESGVDSVSLGFLHDVEKLGD